MKRILLFSILSLILLIPNSFAQPIITINSPLNQTYLNGTTILNISISESANLTIYLNEINITYLENVTEYHRRIYGKDTFNLTVHAENENGTDEKSVIFTLVNGGASINVTECGSLSTEYETYYLTQDIINSSATCFSTVNNIIFDCQWYTIDGINLGDGIRLESKNNITIKNCILTDWNNGIYSYFSDNIILENLKFDRNNLDIYMYGTRTKCHWNLINVTGTGNNSIVFFNTSNIVIKDWNNNASEIILCGADNSVIDNITLNYNALTLVGTSYTNISNSFFNNSRIYLFSSSNYNTFSNITTNGIFFDTWNQYNTLSNIVTRNSTIGIELHYYEQFNNFSNITVDSNRDGIRIGYHSDNNIIKDSIIKNNYYGIYFESVGGNLIYNNLFNNTINVYYWGGSFGNKFNTTRQVGTRIYSAGTEIGGNYWTNPSGNGYSDTCTDADRDGFCDQPYILYSDTYKDIDYLPLSNKYAYLSITFSYSSIDFGTLQHNTINPAPNQALGIYNVSVDTNSNYVVKAYGNDFTPYLSISNLKFDTNSSVENLDINQAISLSTSSQTIDTYPPTVTINYHGYWLNIPYGQYATTYTTTVTINYEIA
jgi:parallel beta-helix repeat protein